MKVIFLRSRSVREDHLIEALRSGIPLSGDEIEVRSILTDESDLDCDGVAIVGMKKQQLFERRKEKGYRLIYFDKAPRCTVPHGTRGYHHFNFGSKAQKTLWQAKNTLWRVAVDTNQPLEYVENAKHGPERWNELGLTVSPWRKPSNDGHIIVANSSEKYHEFYGLLSPDKWAEETVKQIRRYTKRPIWYRPKPVWAARGAPPIEGTRYCPTQHLDQLLPGCHAVVTHGSYICVDALLHGVPSITLGPAITRSVSSQDISEIDNPKLGDEKECLQLLYNMAWCQYRLGEWRNGFAWESVKRLLF